MAVAPVKPYEGKEPYIFISYSHKDSDRVFPILKFLDEKGYRVWYDEGIDPGTEWPESIAQHLMHSAVCLAFVSANSLASQNCRREINFALSRSQIGFLSVMLEDAKMTPGVELQLSTYQSLLMYKYPQKEEFYDKLIHVDLLEPCRRPQAAVKEPASTVQHAAPEKVQQPAAKKDEIPAPQKAEKPAGEGGKNKKPLIIGAAALAVIALIVAIIMMTSGKSDDESTKSAEGTTAATQASEEQTAAKTTEAATEAQTDATEAQTEEPTEAETLPAGELSDDLADATFRLDDVVYQLPFAFSQLTENGWTISSSGTSDQTMVPADKPLSFRMVRNGASVEVTAVNAGKEDLPVADCQIGVIKAEWTGIQDASRFSMAKGINPFSSWEEIKEAFGPAAALITRSNSVRLTYGPSGQNCTSFDYFPDSEKNNVVTVTRYPSAPKAERKTELSDDVSDFTFLLDGVLYQLPFDFTQLVENGWTISSRGISDQTRIGGYQDQYFDMTKNGATITVYAINAGGNARAIADSQIGAISIQQAGMPDADRFCTAKNITLFSTLEEISSALGEGDEVSEMSNYTSVTYGDYSENRTRFLVYSDTTRYNKIEIKNYPTEPEPTETVLEVPAYLASYAAPTELGDDLFAGIAEINDVLYQLPAPLSSFLENGWEISDRPGYVAALGKDSVTLVQGDVKMEVQVRNFAEVQTLTVNCAVSQINVQPEAAISFTLPQNVGLGTRKSVLDDLGLDFYTSEFKEYFYYTKTKNETGVTVGLRIGKEDEQVESFRLEGGAWNY